MSWEEGSKQRYKCPCGEGEYEVILSSDDWGRYRTSNEMLCPKCKEVYVYSSQNIRPNCKPFHEVERGWVLKSVLETERKMQEEKNKARQQIMIKIKELYYDMWQEKFYSLKTKKDIHKIFITGNAYETFCRNTKNYTKDELLEYVNHSFRYSNIKKIFDVCGVEPEWTKIGATEEFINEIMGI